MPSIDFVSEIKQAVRVVTQYAPACCTPDAAAQLLPIPWALLPIAVGAMNINELMNINDVRESATIFPRSCKLTFDLLTLKVVSESRTCDVGYLCANFGLPRPLCSWVIPDVRNWPPWGWGIINVCMYVKRALCLRVCMSVCLCVSVMSRSCII